MRIITVARKPFKSSVASNVLTHQCGGINIDACRISSSGDHMRGAVKAADTGMCASYEASKHGGMTGKGFIATDHPGGRWPANLILQHRLGCECVGIKRVRGSGTSKTFHEGYEGKSITGFVRGHSHPGNQHADKDGKETVAAWRCVSECPVKELDTQSGVQKSGVAGGKSRAWGAGGDVVLSSAQDGVGWKAYNSEGYGDEGGASRFFKQVKEN